MQHIDSDLIRGNIDTIILKTMLNEDKYGLDIIKEVGEKSSGTYELKQPTLYSCLKRLENQELISSYWVDSDIGGRRHYYKLTDKGREFYNKKQEEWAKSKFIIDNLLSNYDYEEYRLVKKDEFDEVIRQKANSPLANFSSSEEVLETEAVVEEPTINSAPEDATEEQTEDDFSEETDTFSSVEEIDEIDSEYSYTPDESDEDSAFENDYSDETINYSANSENDGNVFDLGETDQSDPFEDEETLSYSEPDNNDYPVYFSARQAETEDDEPQNNVSYETTDQTSNELNILSRLRSQDDEINTYYGDHKSYVNHLNQLDESQLEQQDLLDSSLYVRPDLVNKSIDEFNDAIEKLNNFNFSSNQTLETAEETEETTEDFDNTEPETYTNNFDNDNEDNEELDAFDDLNELESLKNLSSNEFFYSNDNSKYDEVAKRETPTYESFNTISENEDYEAEDFSFNEQTSQSFDEIASEIEPRNDYSFETSETEQYDNSFIDYNRQENLDDIDTIISNNIATVYPEATQHFYKTTNVNYKEKLSDLSKYSKVTLEEETPAPSNAEALEKAKDIAEITKELEEEGIRIKEHYKTTNLKKLDKNYLLSNKISFIKSLIMFFGYVFILSALYIVLNNTSMKDSSWFSIKPFLIGFIPFAIILIYRGSLFAINPYKKIDAKYHSRIMMFISIIITIQLLLITYCVNLQLGFYSFAQKGYNHLYLIIPTIISFAPIIDNLVYIALFKSKNFNV